MTVSLAVVGAGNRGSTSAGYAQRHPQRARVVAVAEPRPGHRTSGLPVLGRPLLP
ncbi:hypothetical protein [Micromonospora sp. NPDC005299]|uniref:hypothetical protein n=1 Tax=Micromonospora sp. NPDC005299 TaxID=3364231 RepID=UPI0036CD6848